MVLTLTARGGGARFLSTDLHSAEEPGQQIKKHHRSRWEEMSLLIEAFIKGAEEERWGRRSEVGWGRVQGDVRDDDDTV